MKQHSFKIFSNNSEADASELLENVAEMFPLYYINTIGSSSQTHTHVIYVLKGFIFCSYTYDWGT